MLMDYCEMKVCLDQHSRARLLGRFEVCELRANTLEVGTGRWNVEDNIRAIH